MVHNIKMPHTGRKGMKLWPKGSNSCTNEAPGQDPEQCNQFVNKENGKQYFCQRNQNLNFYYADRNMSYHLQTIYRLCAHELRSLEPKKNRNFYFRYYYFIQNKVIMMSICKGDQLSNPESIFQIMMRINTLDADVDFICY